MSPAHIFFVMGVAAATAYIVFIIGFGWQTRSNGSRQLLALLAAVVCVAAPLIALRYGSTEPMLQLSRSLVIATSGLSALGLLALLSARSRFEPLFPGAAAGTAEANTVSQAPDSQSNDAQLDLADAAIAAADQSHREHQARSADPVSKAMRESEQQYLAMRDQIVSQDLADQPVDLPDDAPWLTGADQNAHLDDVELDSNVSPAKAGEQQAIEREALEADWQDNTTETIDPATVAGGLPAAAEPDAEEPRLTAAQAERNEQLLETERRARALAAERARHQAVIIDELRADVTRLQHRIEGLEAEKQDQHGKSQRLNKTARNAARLARQAAEARRKAESLARVEREARIRQEAATRRAVDIARNAIAALSSAQQKTTAP